MNFRYGTQDKVLKHYVFAKCNAREWSQNSRYGG